jgi:hypothetical protein
VCRLVLSGAPDPRNACQDQGKASCGTDGTCSGNGACRRYAPGTVCGQGNCNPVNNLRTLPATCDGNGQCAPGLTTSCGAYRCNGTSCFTACGADTDCVAPNTCSAGVCSQKGSGATCSKPSDCAPPLSCIGSTCQPKPLSYPCTSNGECMSGFCTDGVCCQREDCGPCSRCNVSDFVGFCHAVPAGAAHQSCAATPATMCGHDGTCDGAGKCRFHPAGTVCGAASCNGQQRIRPRTCDGAGTCRDNGTTDCAPYTCNPAASDCFRSCTTDDQCCCNNNCARGSNSCQ